MCWSLAGVVKGHVLVPKLLQAGHDVTVLDKIWFGNFLEDNDKQLLLKVTSQRLIMLPLMDLMQLSTSLQLRMTPAVI